MRCEDSPEVSAHSRQQTTLHSCVRLQYSHTKEKCANEIKFRMRNCFCSSAQPHEICAGKIIASKPQLTFGWVCLPQRKFILRFILANRNSAIRSYCAELAGYCSCHRMICTQSAQWNFQLADNLDAKRRNVNERITHTAQYPQRATNTSLCSHAFMFASFT